jgi:hypothetical protein
VLLGQDGTDGQGGEYLNLANSPSSVTVPPIPSFTALSSGREKRSEQANSIS